MFSCGLSAGSKSTLLKILSRVTAPTSGQVKVKGRIASLLEVGTGFNPELTGRENIYLNGAILGMTRREIDWKFDEIVAFSEVEKFLDTPVKRYSSGMYVRLAFAVAAHLDPEILVVDEVLAVGDVQFQRKCLGKMSKVAGEGKTVLFVSHNMAAVRQLCTTACWLDGGRIVQAGQTPEVVAAYENSGYSVESANGIFRRKPVHVSGKPVWIQSISLENDAKQAGLHVKYDAKLQMSIDIGGEVPTNSYIVEWCLFNQKGEYVAYGGSHLTEKFYSRNQRTAFVSIGPLPLTLGRFWFSLGIRNTTKTAHWDWWEHAAYFDVDECSPTGSGFLLPSANFGSVYINQSWN